MSPLHRQRGATGGLIAVILILVVVAFLAAKLLSQLTGRGERDSQVGTQFRAIQQGLVQYVAANGRLPCPANPAVDDGDEVDGGNGACTHGDGTVPWKTLALRRDDAIDPWGGKISYRVYTGSAGSLTQAGGASAVQCDTVEPSPSTVTPVVGVSGGLCRTFTSVTQRTTPPGSYAAANSGYFAGKGLVVNDMTVSHDAAYVLVSHGPTGLGAYTTSGVRRDLPAAGGHELANTTAAGPFWIEAFSGSASDPAASSHFDDYLAYQRLEDLIKAAGVGARDWPEEATSSVTFDRPTVQTAVGHNVTPGQSVGSSTVAFSAGVSVSGLVGGSTATDLSYGEVGIYGGMGVAGGGSAKLQSSAGEKIRVDFNERATKLGLTLNDFGYYSSRYIEILELEFFLDGVAVGTPKFALGCHVDGGLATFEITTVGTVWNRVDMTPVPAFDVIDQTLTGNSELYITQVKSCPASDSCTTSLYDAGNFCGYVE